MIHPGEHVVADPCGAGSGRGGRRRADRLTNQRTHHEPCRRQSRTHHRRRQGHGCRSRGAAHRRRREGGPRGRAGYGWRGAGSRTRSRGPIRTPRRDAGERLANALRLTLAEFGHLDVLVTTAGIANGSPIGDFPLALRQKTVEINLTGSFLGMKTVSRVLTSQGTVPSSTCPPSKDGGAVLGPGTRVQLDDFECRPVDRRAHSLPCLPQRPTVDRAAAVAGATDLVHGPDAFLQRAGCGLTAQCGAAPGAA